MVELEILKEMFPDIDFNRERYLLGDFFKHQEGLYLTTSNDLEKVRAVCLKQGNLKHLPGDDVVFDYSELPYTNLGEELINKVKLSQLMESRGYGLEDIKLYDRIYLLGGRKYIIFPKGKFKLFGIAVKDLRKENRPLYIFDR